MRFRSRLISFVPLLAALASLSACKDIASGEGYVSIREPRYFDRNLRYESHDIHAPRSSLTASMTIRKCELKGREAPGPFADEREQERYERYRREELPRLRRECENAYEFELNIPSLYTIFSRIMDVQCRDGSDGRLICRGDAYGQERWGDVRYVAVIRDRKLLRFRILQMAPACGYPREDQVREECLGQFAFFTSREPRVLGEFRSYR